MPSITMDVLRIITDQRVRNDRGATRIPVDHVAVSLLVQGRRSTNVREGKRRRAGIVEHKTRARRNAPAEVGFPVAVVVYHGRGKYYVETCVHSSYIMINYT